MYSWTICPNYWKPLTTTRKRSTRECIRLHVNVFTRTLVNTIRYVFGCLLYSRSPLCANWTMPPLMIWRNRFTATVPCASIFTCAVCAPNRWAVLSGNLDLVDFAFIYSASNIYVISYTGKFRVNTRKPYACCRLVSAMQSLFWCPTKMLSSLPIPPQQWYGVEMRL